MSFAPRHELASSLRLRHLVHSFCCTLVVASLAMPGAAAVAHSARSTKARLTLPDAPTAPARIRSADEPGFAETESGCAEGRIRDYLERHGDFGLIDPEALLEVSRQVQMERENRVHTLSIAGSVWTSIGPTNGAGRATAVAVHPTVPGTAIIGAAGGGAWKTTDSGATWTPLTDSIPNLSIGAVSFAPSNPSIVYLGTGEGGSAIDFIPGIGLLSSADGGTTWNLPASVLATEFYRISVNPSNPNDLVVGTNAGALRSTNGQNGPWTTVIASTSSTGAAYGDVTDIVRDPTNAQVLYAATWDRQSWCQMRNCSAPYNYASPTILKSVDAGQTWSPAATNLPVSTASVRVNRWSLAIAPSSPQTLYAATSIYDPATGVETSHIYKTTNGAGSWSETALSVNSSSGVSKYLLLQGWYDNTIVVSPTDPNTVVAAGVTYVKSTDGGTTWTNPNFTGTQVHVDAHDLRYDAGGTLYIANDGGIWTSPDSGDSATARNANLVTRQYYSLANDPANRNRVIGGMQDNGTNRRPDSGGTLWDFFSGSDGMQCGISSAVSGVAWSTTQYGGINRSMNAGAPSPTVAGISPAYDSGEPKPFLTKLLLDPNNLNSVYTTTYRIWRSKSGGDAWLPLATTTTDGSTWRSDTYVTALAVARSDSNVIMAAQYATVFRSTNGGTTWVRASTGLPGRTVNAIEIDPHNPLVAYAALAGMSGTSVYLTTNGGVSWSPAGSGLPSFSAQVVRVDPTDSSTIYCGTDVGVYRSIDSGATWTRFGSGLPAVSVYDIQILSDGSIVRAATHGRGVWQLTVTGTTNTPPTVSISAPTAAQTVARGSTVSFTGTFSDPDAGDVVTGTWTFPDSWQTQAATPAGTVTHEFDKAGTFPVTLAAKDSHGAITATAVNVSVPVSGDDCASPITIPPAGPFPWTAMIDLAAATRQASDPSGGPSCYPYTLMYNASVWLTFTPAVSGTYQFSACGSGIGAAVIAYTGNACGSYTPAPALCYTDMFPTSNCGNDPIANATLSAGTTIHILVTSYWTADAGPIALTVTQNSNLTPALIGIAPSSGGSGGGTAIAVTGSGFATGATMSIGGVAATGVTVVSPSILTAVTGPHAPGLADVSVANPGGAPATLGGAFYYSTPIAGTPLAGDANGDGSVNAADIFYLVNYLFGGGPLPVSGDADGDGKVTAADVFYLINYVFAGGPVPR